VSDKKVGLVTGAGRGIGREICLGLAENGYDIAGVDILFDSANTQNGLFEVKQKVEGLNQDFLPLQADVSDLDSHQTILDKTLARYGKIDGLVNNAGVAPAVRLDVLDTTAESYDRLLSINARGAFFLTQKTAKHMIRQVENEKTTKPCIIFISSISAYVSSPSRPEYCISKAAVSMTAKIFADRLSEHGINVYEVRPGIIQTDMTAPVKEKYDKLIAEGLVPQKRWGYPEDVAKAVVALARGDFAYSTGLVVEVSGGMNIQRL
jgi:NAD(P)-dependent dehydrogenase (short-subunit alcohol dehydrogenase family)